MPTAWRLSQKAIEAIGKKNLDKDQYNIYNRTDPEKTGSPAKSPDLNILELKMTYYYCHTDSNNDDTNDNIPRITTITWFIDSAREEQTKRPSQLYLSDDQFVERLRGAHHLVQVEIHDELPQFFLRGHLQHHLQRPLLFARSRKQTPIY